MDEAPIIDLQSDHYFMGEALRQAVRAYEAEEVPIGAVVVRDGRVIARAFNQVELLKDATAHAEMLAMTQAESVVGDWRLTDCTLYVTKEPCPMCAGAVVHVRLARVVFGAADAKAGAAGSVMNLLQFPTLNHKSQITAGVREPECRTLLQNSSPSSARKTRAARRRLTDRNQRHFVATMIACRPLRSRIEDQFAINHKQIVMMAMGQRHIEPPRPVGHASHPV